MSAICEFLHLEFDQDKLRNHPKTAEKIVKPFEHWKKDVTSNIYKRKIRVEDLFSKKEILKIKSIVFR